MGEHNVVSVYEGTVVQHLPPGELPTPKDRPRPQMRLPKATSPALGRETELEVARRVLAEADPVEFYGPAGAGKSALLAEIAAKPGAVFPDGVVHANLSGTALEDVFQWLFEVFWEAERPWAPGRLRVAEYVRQLRALVVLDDVGLSPDECAALVDALEGSTLVLASTEPRLAGSADGALRVRGLSAAAAIEAFERCLRRPLTESEAGLVSEVVRRVDGAPGPLLDAARAVRDGVLGLSELGTRPEGELERERLRALGEGQRTLLSVLIEVAPAAVPVQLLERTVGAPPGDAEALESAGLAESRSPRYALARPLPKGVGEDLPRVPVPSLLAQLADAARRSEVDEQWAPAALAALDWGRRSREHDAVVDAARALDTALLAALRIGAWGGVIAAGAAAAHQRGRTSDEAYFLHQQGTRALLVGNHERAEDQLRRALALRERLDDGPGAAATWHNLEVLHGSHGRRAAGTLLGPVPAGGRGSRPWRSRPLGRLAAGAIGLAAGVALGLLIGNNSSQPPATGAANISRAPRVVRVTSPATTIVISKNTTTNLPGPSPRTVTATTTIATSTAVNTTTVNTNTTVSTHNQVCIDC